MGEKKTVLIVDDHPLFRQGLKSLLAKHSGLEVIGEAENCDEGLRKAKELRPDLVVMDISLPDGSGIEVTHNIRGLLPETRVVILSMHSDIDDITEAFRAGATAYVVKESAADRLSESLEAVSKGESFIDPSIHLKVMEDLTKFRKHETSITDAGYNILTRREQEILRLLSQGLSTKKIAEKLFISPKTVRNHRSNIMSKLDLHGAIELVRYAVKLGLTDMTDRNLWQK